MLRKAYNIAALTLTTVLATLFGIVLFVGFDEFDRMTIHEPGQTIILVIGGISAGVLIVLSIVLRRQ